MGVRGEIYSTRMSCEGRTYFFNIKENRMGDLFLTIVESKPTEGDTFDRRSIVIFKDNMQDFLKAFEKSLDAMQKTPDRPRSDSVRRGPRDDGREDDHRLTDDEKPRHYLGQAKPRRDEPHADRDGRHGDRPQGRDSARPARREAGRDSGREGAPARKTTGRVLKVSAKKNAAPGARSESKAADKKPARKLTVRKVERKDD